MWVGSQVVGETQIVGVREIRSGVGETSGIK